MFHYQIELFKFPFKFPLSGMEVGLFWDFFVLSLHSLVHQIEFFYEHDFTKEFSFSAYMFLRKILSTCSKLEQVKIIPTENSKYKL